MTFENILKYINIVKYYFNILYKILKYVNDFNSILLIKNILIFFKILLFNIINKIIILNKNYIYITYPYVWLYYNSKKYFKNIIITTEYKNNINLIYKILNIKNISAVKKSGILRKFSIVTLLGNKLNWIGLGKSKNIYLIEALENSYIKAFNKIIYFNSTLLGEFMYNNIKYKIKNTHIILKNFNYTNFISNCVKLNLIFKTFGIINIHLNILTKLNFENIIKVLIKLNNIPYKNIIN